MLRASFVIPTKNNASTVGLCLDSLMPYYEQYIRDIVVVDGASTDGTLEIVGRFPVKILADPGKGQNLAYEIGWRHSEGDPVIFLDADAYLGDGFFPIMHRYFDDDTVGIVGCPSHWVVSGGLSRTVSQWEEYSDEALFRPRGVIQWAHRLSRRRKDDPVPPCGPCQAVRRKCLEGIDGYRGVSLGLPTDDVLASRVIANGWRSHCWLDSPLYHHARSTIRGLVGEALRWGRERLYFRRDPEFRPMNSLNQQIFYVLGSLASPVLGMILALRFGNPWHAVLFPLTRYAALAGYLRALWSPDTAERVP